MHQNADRKSFQGLSLILVFLTTDRLFRIDLALPGIYGGSKSLQPPRVWKKIIRTGGATKTTALDSLRIQVLKFEFSLSKRRLFTLFRNTLSAKMNSLRR